MHYVQKSSFILHKTRFEAINNIFISFSINLILFKNVFKKQSYLNVLILNMTPI